MNQTFVFCLFTFDIRHYPLANSLLIRLLSFNLDFYLSTFVFCLSTWTFEIRNPKSTIRKCSLLLPGSASLRCLCHSLLPSGRHQQHRPAGFGMKKQMLGT